MADKEFHVAFRKFLESDGLYRKLPLGDDPKPWIHAWEHGDVNLHLYCPRCKGQRTFRVAQDRHELKAQRAYVLEARCYECADCHWCHVWYVVMPGDDYALKVGQFPRPAVEISPDLEGCLGEEDKEFYRKGRFTELQAYGIGAFAYYRRVVENLMGRLIDEIEAAMTPGEKDKYGEALNEARAAHNADEKLELVKDCLPASLRKPGDPNPLQVLHEDLSVGIYGLSDEECLDRAEDIRTILDHVLGELSRRREKDTRFTASMKKALGRRSKAKKEGG